MKWIIFRYNFLLVPVAIVAFREPPNLWYREVLIFGVRLAYWTIRPWEQIMTQNFVHEQDYEITRARQKFPNIRSLHEGYAIIKEEVDEFWDVVKRQHDQRDPEHMRKELIQIAAMAQRCAEDCL